MPNSALCSGDTHIRDIARSREAAGLMGEQGGNKSQLTVMSM